MNTNSIAFIALCNEYCTLLQGSESLTTLTFTEKLLRLLPRIYICACDLKPELTIDSSEVWISQSLTEEEYDYIKSSIGRLYGENDVYLEVFEEDMKYSETPVATSISENMADIYQALYDFLQTVRMGTDEIVAEAVDAICNSFREYWSAILCNVLRALNHLWSKGLLETEDYEQTF